MDKEKRVSKREKPKKVGYNLILDQEEYDAVLGAATRRDTTFKEIIMRSIRLGLLAVEVEKSPHKQLVVQETAADGKISESRIILY